MKPTVWMVLKSLFIIPEICIYQSRNTVVFDYPRKYLIIPEICNCQSRNTIMVDYPKNLQLSEPEDLVMLHIHGGGFISQVKLVADMISTG